MKGAGGERLRGGHIPGIDDSANITVTVPLATVQADPIRNAECRLAGRVRRQDSV